MLFDRQSLLSEAQAVTVTAASTNVLDLLDTGRIFGTTADLKRDVGKSAHMPLVIQCVEAFATCTSVEVQVQTCAVEGFGSGVKTVSTSGAIPVASLVAGFRFLPDFVPRGVDERYMRLNYVVVGTAASAGKITAGIVAGAQTNS